MAYSSELIVHKAELTQESPVFFHNGKNPDYRAIAENVLSNLELKNQLVDSRLDPLTLLLNWGAFQIDLHSLVSRAETNKTGLLLAVLDVDGLKRANDKLGHPKGDKLLQSVASGLQEGIRPVDKAYRIGGDEFAVLAANYDLEKSDQAPVNYSSRLHRIVTDHIMGSGLELDDLWVGVSVGTAAYMMGQGSEALYTKADAMMYEEKLSTRLILKEAGVVFEDSRQ